MGMWGNIDNGLYCMFMNKMEIIEAVANKLEEEGDYYSDMCDDNAVDMIAAACADLNYDFDDLNDYDIEEIGKRMGWL